MSFIRSPVRQVPYQQQSIFSPTPSRVSINGAVYPSSFSYQSPQISRAPISTGQPVRASMLNQSIPGFRPQTLQQISQPSLTRPFLPPQFVQQAQPQIIKPVFQAQPQIQEDKMLQTLKKENRELKEQFIKYREDLERLKLQEDELNQQLNQFRSQSQVEEQ